MQSFDTNTIEKLHADSQKNIQLLSKKALESYDHLGGTPNKKNEAYKYSSLYKSLPDHFVTSTQKHPHLEISQTQDCYLVFQDGVFTPEKSTLCSNTVLTESLLEGTPLLDPYECMNVAIKPLTYKLTIEEKSQAKITVIHTGHEENQKAHLVSNLEIELKKEANALIIEKFEASLSKAFLNTLTSLQLSENTVCTYIKDIDSQLVTNHVGKLQANLERSSKLYSFTLSFGYSISRHNIEVNLNGEGSEVYVDGIYFLEKNQEADHFSTINHNAPHSFSHQLFKGIVKDESHSIFTGKILVKKDSQQVESEQLNKSIILSQKAKVDTRPQLEVYADDVKCAHGATIGQLDQEEIFYLQTRGLNQTRSFQLVCRGFLFEVLERLTDTKAKDYLSKKVSDRLLSFDFKNSGGTDA